LFRISAKLLLQFQCTLLYNRLRGYYLSCLSYLSEFGAEAEFIKHHFLKYAPSARPLLLLLDGHSSHYCHSAIHQAAEQKVVLLTLPPNTTQPLDKGIFGPLKSEWRKVCHEFTVKNPGKLLTLCQFSTQFAKPWTNSMTIKNLMASFHTTGLFPVDRCKALATVQSTIATAIPHSKTVGLTYLPLLMPIPSP